MRKLICILSCIFAIGFSAAVAQKTEAIPPDLEKIKIKTTDENSKFYYPKLLGKFMANDSSMTNEEFKYFYYGTMFQEDYDPYREPYDEAKLQEIRPLYYKQSHTREERDSIMKYARNALADNPLDLQQLKNLIFVYEQNKKTNLAKIWKYKLNHLLLTIASSGTGFDPEHAWWVVYPRHEFDFLNISGLTVQSDEFVEPYYEKLNVNKRSEKEPGSYYFNIQPVLEEYYRKHPSEK